MNAKDAQSEAMVRPVCVKHAIFDDGTHDRCRTCEAEESEYQHYLRELARVEP